MADTPLLRAQTTDEQIRLMAAGAWTAANAAELKRRMEAVALMRQPPALRSSTCGRSSSSIPMELCCWRDCPARGRGAAKQCGSSRWRTAIKVCCVSCTLQPTQGLKLPRGNSS